MKKYKHWLVLDMMNSNTEQASELINELIEHKKEFKADIELYYRDSGAFEHIFKVESPQCYNDLNLSCNSISNSFHRLTQKPKNIHKGIEFNEYIQRYDFQ